MPSPTCPNTRDTGSIHRFPIGNTLLMKISVPIITAPPNPTVNISKDPQEPQDVLVRTDAPDAPDPAVPREFLDVTVSLAAKVVLERTDIPDALARMVARDAWDLRDALERMGALDLAGPWDPVASLDALVPLDALGTMESPDAEDLWVPRESLAAPDLKDALDPRDVLVLLASPAS